VPKCESSSLEVYHHAPTLTRKLFVNAGDEEKLKCKEQWLRDELRAARTLLVSQMQWGITVLAAVEINLYYIRRDAKAYLIEQNIINTNESFPLVRWLVGTSFLLVLAFVFSRVMKRASDHHRAYRTQLVNLNGGYSGIEETIKVGDRVLNMSPSIMFFSMPAFDFILWFIFLAIKAQVAI
jgi:hypothetical protein